MTSVIHALVAFVALQNGLDVDTLVTRYIATAEEYRKSFQNLTAEETKTLELYRPSGEPDKRRAILSDLVVNRATRNGKDGMTEYRDVRAVDGKPVKGGRERALELLTRASKAESLEQELEAINRETFRYEFRQRHLRNLSLVQDTTPERRRATLRFESLGTGQIAGHVVVVVRYQDTEPSPTIQLPLPKEFGPPAFFHRGQLWLDAATGQLWRSVSEIVARHPASSEPLVLIHAEYTYGPSDFGMFVPQRIVWDWMSHYSHPKNGQPSFTLAERTTFSYANFKRFNVATDERVKNLP